MLRTPIQVLSCYASPTFTAREEKNAFLDCLQQTLSEISSSESFVMLVGFNAHVESKVRMKSCG